MQYGTKYNCWCSLTGWLLLCLLQHLQVWPGILYLENSDSVWKQCANSLGPCLTRYKKKHRLPYDYVYTVKICFLCWSMVHKCPTASSCVHIQVLSTLLYAHVIIPNTHVFSKINSLLSKYRNKLFQIFRAFPQAATPRCASLLPKVTFVSLNHNMPLNKRMI
jgi:hypothetical protein